MLLMDLKVLWYSAKCENMYVHCYTFWRKSKTNTAFEKAMSENTWFGSDLRHSQTRHYLVEVRWSYILYLKQRWKFAISSLQNQSSPTALMIDVCNEIPEPSIQWSPLSVTRTIKAKLILLIPLKSSDLNINTGLWIARIVWPFRNFTTLWSPPEKKEKNNLKSHTEEVSITPLRHQNPSKRKQKLALHLLSGEIQN